MNKSDFFLHAMHAQMFKKKHWNISAFSIFEEEPEDWKKDPYPYRVVVKDNGKYFFVDPNDTTNLIAITDATPKQPLFSFREKINLVPSKGDIDMVGVPNLKKPITSTYGNAMFNFMVLIYAFGPHYEYVEGAVNPSKLENAIVARLQDTPPEGAERDPNMFYVDQLLRYMEAMGALVGLTQLCVPAASVKTITVNKDILKRRDELLLEYKEQLTDPAVVAKIEKELTDMYAESLKGDPAEGFVNKKNITVSLKKALIMHGAERGFGDSGGEVDTITTSLSEGWNIEKLPSYANNLRSGTFSRGAETELGGEAVKFFNRVFQNTRVAEDDCGVKNGMKWSINQFNYLQFVGLYQILSGGKIELLTEDTLKKSVGKVIEIRTPMLCKTVAPSYCATCMGKIYGSNPTGLGSAAASVGSKFMLAFMGAMHGKALTTSKLLLKESIS